MREQLPEYTYTKNEKTFTEVMIGFVQAVFDPARQAFHFQIRGLSLRVLRNGITHVSISKGGNVTGYG